MLDSFHDDASDRVEVSDGRITLDQLLFDSTVLGPGSEPEPEPGLEPLSPRMR
jgi:hypothetical protein